jgi:hypothetical protein
VLKNKAHKTRMSKEKKRYREQRRSLKFTNIVEENPESGDRDILSIPSNLDHLINFLIFDSTCSYHTKPSKDWLDTYKLINSGFVLMGNDNPYKFVEIRISKLKCLMVLLKIYVMLDVY